MLNLNYYELVNEIYLKRKYIKREFCSPKLKMIDFIRKFYYVEKFCGLDLE